MLQTQEPQGRRAQPGTGELWDQGNGVWSDQACGRQGERSHCAPRDSARDFMLQWFPLEGLG